MTRGAALALMVAAPVLWSSAGVVTRHIERAEPIEEPEVLHDQERGDQHHLQRHHQGGEEHEVHEPPSEEPDPGERIGRKRAQDEVARDDRDGHDGRVPEPRAERRVAEHVDVVAEPQRARPQDRREVKGLRLGLERGDAHPHERQEHHDGERDEEQVPRVERQEPPPRPFDHPGLAGQGPRIGPGPDGRCLGDGIHEE